MEYETIFLIIAAVLSFSDLTPLSMSKLNEKRKISYGVYAIILAQHSAEFATFP
jgi:hypothetical protein